MDITIGKMDKIVKFESPSKEGTPSGGQVATYEEWLQTFAMVKPVSGFRNFNEGFDYSATRFDIVLRWRQMMSDNIVKDTKIIFDNRRCSINGTKIIYQKQEKYYLFTVVEKH